MSNSADAKISDRWFTRVRHIQLEQLTPDVRARLCEHAELRRSAEAARRTCRSMSFRSSLSRSLVHEGLRQMSDSTTSTHFAGTSTRWSDAQRRTSEHSRELSTPDPDVSFAWRDEDMEFETLAQASQLIGATNLNALAPSANHDAVDAAEPLLDQLRTEPTDDEEAQAKFAMYETYSEEVGRMREALFSFHVQHRDSLPSAVEQHIAKELKGIDSASAMGLPDDTPEWFVFHMMKQATKNNRIMEGVLKGCEKKLEFLATNEQAECPICMDAFGVDKPSEVLGCCHTVCRECWENWTAVRHGKPFCPICRHDDFIGVMATSVTSDPSPGPWQAEPLAIAHERPRAVAPSLTSSRQGPLRIFRTCFCGVYQRLHAICLHCRHRVTARR